MDCYWFCSQYKDYFKTAGAKKSNKILFAASFLRKSVTRQWLQHKQRLDRAAPMTCPEFKDFFQKNFGDSRAFIDGIQSKMKRDFQYQDKLVQEWAAHLKYLQLMLFKFDAEWVSGKATKICYFREALKPSVQAEIEQCGRELKSFKKLIQKAIEGKAKADLWLCSYICNTDQYCLRGSRSAHSTIAKILPQGQ